MDVEDPSPVEESDLSVSSHDDSGDEYLPDKESDSSDSESSNSAVFPFLLPIADAKRQGQQPSQTEPAVNARSSPDNFQLQAAGLYTSTASTSHLVPPKSGYGSSAATNLSASMDLSASTSSATTPSVKHLSSASSVSSSKVFVHVAVKSNGKRVYNKKNKCAYCQTRSTNLTKHLFSKHGKEEADVALVLSKPKKSAERDRLLEQIRNKGNYNHNCSVLEANEGEIIPWRSPTETVDPREYVPCEFCVGFFLKKELWRHEQTCKFRTTCRKGRKVISRAESLLPSSTTCSKGLLENVFGSMNSDKITFVARHDSLITTFGEKLYQKHGHIKHRRTHIKQKMRELARFLIAAREMDSAITDLKSCISPNKFLNVISAVKKLCGYNSLENAYENPSLALKLGHAFKKCSGILRCQALMEGNDELQKVALDFIELCELEWKEHISTCALSTLENKKYNKPHVLPLTEDMKKVTKYMSEEREKNLATLISSPTTAAWHALAKISLSNIIMFNRRRSGEAARMLVKDFEDAKRNSLPEDDVLAALSEMEKELVRNFTRVEVRGKRGRKVPVLLTDTMCYEIQQLLAFRKEAGVHPSNTYMFARPYFSSDDHIAGHSCLKDAVLASGAEKPEHITSTKLRKHLATVSQILNLNEHELEQVCGFLGHNISVHREYYRLPQDTYQLAKVSRLLIAAESGNISRFQGQSLSDIHLDNDLEFHDSDVEEDDVSNDAAVEGDSGVVCVPTSSATYPAGERENPDLCSSSFPTSSKSRPTPSDGNVRGKPIHKPSKTRDFLTSEQMHAVRKHFKRNIEHFFNAKKEECVRVLEREPLLQGKSWTKIKSTVRNEIEKKRREVKSLQNRRSPPCHQSE